jgi:hypothetical protein
LDVNGTTFITGSLGVTGSVEIIGPLTASNVVVSGSSKLILGTTTPDTVLTAAGDVFQILSTSATFGFIGRYSNNANGARFGFFKSRATTIGGRAIVQAGDNLGRLVWFADNGGATGTEAAIIFAENVAGAAERSRILFAPGSTGVGLVTKFIVDEFGAQVTGSLQVESGITGSLFGTSSWAITASYALNAAGGGGSGLISSSFQLTNNQGFAFTTASNVTFNQVTSSFMMLRSPSTSSNASIVFSGSLTSSISLEVLQNGALSFMGNNGALFDITDSVSGSLMSVNDASGLPILEVFSDDRVVMGAYNQNTLIVTGSDVGIGKVPNPSFVLDVSGSSAFSGSVFITGSLVVSGTISNVSASVNYIPRFVSSSILRESNIVDTGTNIGFFKTAPTSRIDMVADAKISGSLDVSVNGAAGWDRFFVTSSRNWGDAASYVTIGTGSGISGIMIYNPHIVWNAGNAASALRIGRSAGLSGGAWYEVGVGATDDFFISKNGGRAASQLYISSAGNISINKIASGSAKLDVNGGIIASGSIKSSYFSVEPYLGVNGIIGFTGSNSASIRLETLSDGSISFIGSSGTLFGISDSLSGSLMSVSDITGLPILEVFSDDRVVMGKFGSNALVVSGSTFFGTGSILGTAYFMVVTSSATNITMSLAEAGDYFRTTAATAVGIQIPPQSSVAWPSNTEIMFEQAGAGQITFTTGSGVTINSSETLKTQKQYSVVAIKRVASDIWTLTGERELL